VPGVAVYGGFDPAGSIDQFNERDWGAYPTVLSGDIGGDDTNTDGVVLTTTDIVGDNSYHVVMADGTSVPITGTTLLDGFTITAGQADGDYQNYSGGGFHCDGSGSGAECSPSLINVTFSGNSAGSGGAMYNRGNNNGMSSPSLSDVVFAGNSADFGGAMLNYGYYGTSSPTLANVTFSGNSAVGWGGAMYNDGNEGTSSPTLTNVTFSGNSAGVDGGAMVNDGRWGGTSSPTLTNVVFSSNSAEYGGAISNDGYDNGDSSPSLANVTFSGNSAEYGGAISNDGRNGTSSPSLSNVILWGNTAVISGTQMFNYEASVTITTSLVQVGIDGSGVYPSGTVIDGGGNLYSDPDFVREPNPGPDGDWDGVDDDYGDLRLGASSPAIDSGTNSAVSLPTDLDGDPRIVDGDMDGTATVDMGAYEFQTYPLEVSLAGTGSGTVSGDGINCGTDCSQFYADGTVVTLTASSDSGSTFSGWGGACSGTGSCTLTMTEAKFVTATFTGLDVYIPLIFR